MGKLVNKGLKTVYDYIPYVPESGILNLFYRNMIYICLFLI